MASNSWLFKEKKKKKGVPGFRTGVAERLLHLTHPPFRTQTSLLTVHISASLLGPEAVCGLLKELNSW